MNRELQEIIDNYKSDQESVFNTWFINNDERLKAFRSIRRGVKNVTEDIKAKSFLITHETQPFSEQELYFNSEP